MRGLTMVWAIAVLLTLGACNDQISDADLRADRSSEALSKSGEGAVLNYVATLSGESSQGRGVARFQLSKDGNSLYYKLNVANIENITVSHIHHPTGPPVVWLFPGTFPPTTPPVPVSGRSDGVLAEGVVGEANMVGPLAGGTFQDLLDLLESGEAWVNVHTTQFPGGEINGDINKGNGVN